MADKKTIKKHYTISFVAGHSGGHILPCLTLAQQIMHKHPDYQVLFFTTTMPLDKQLVTSASIVQHHVPLHIGKFPYKKLYKYPIFIWNFIRSSIQSYKQLKKHKPEAIITTGGYVALPVCLSAKILGIPIELYELNVVPGKTIKLLAPFAYKIWICFEQSLSYLPAQKCSLTSYPIKFFDTSKIMAQQEALQALHFSSDRKTILIVGGSQGSVFINSIIKEWVTASPHVHDKIQIIHHTGSLDDFNWKQFYTTCKIPALVFDYSDAIAQCYAAADLVMCRSGAGTLAEIRFFNKRCITIPLESATTMHQIDNAIAASQSNPELFTVFKQKDIVSNKAPLFSALEQFLS
jgi:UDP-N-acetylglucosamine--N-acetylmuramyl-(pentapeptide) pyrophosphoryl-undecaprenol N-acetylglucosamine transferase